MRLISFKKEYILPLGEGETIRIDPIDRIRRRLKRTTVRKSRMPTGQYRARQGSRFKPEIIQEFYLRFYQRELIYISSLSKKDIQMDLGLTNSELKELMKWHHNLQEFFLEGLQGIKNDSNLKMNSILFLYRFKVIEPQSSTLDYFFQKEDK